ncbi:MAG: site-specific DNA-methyltransferase, partial [Proteobacteria bacterium]|nr:site-specific DNA-methyltransferase [Pseudomonadota bacterium]
YKDNFKLSDQDLIDDFSLNETTKDFLHNVYGTRSHSGWLAFMYPRLKLARDLLRDDGLLIISIDDNEQANLKIICDEIYGEDNFIACLPTIMNLKGNNDEFGFAGTHEYTLVYAKDAACATIGEFDISEDEQDLWHEDETGPWKRGRALKAAGENASRAARPQLFYPIYIDEQSLSVSIVRDEAHTYELLPVTGDKELRWYWSAEKVGKDSSEIIVVKNKNNGYALYKKQRPELGDIPSKKPKSLFYKPAYSSGNGTNLIKSLLGGRVFSNPKPLQLVSDLIALATADVDDALVLDFFAGSGTTGDAVVRLNAFDGGHRKYILVQADEEIDASDQAVAFKFCRDNKIEPVISSITLARLDRAGAEAERLAREIDDIATVSGASSLSLAPAADHASSGRNPRRADTTADSAKMETGGAGTDADSLDIGYRVFSLVKKPAVSQKSQPQTSPGSQAQGGLGLAIDSRRTCALDTLINMMCATGHSLDTPIECLTENVLYRAGADLFVLDSIASAQLEAFPDAQIYLDGWADINLEDYLNLGTGSRENISVVL